MNAYRAITDDQWHRIAPMLPEYRPRKDPRGRPFSSTRAVLNGVLWTLYNGAPWAALPGDFPHYKTCHRRFKAWYDDGVLEKIIQQLFGALSKPVYNQIRSRMR